MTLAFTPPETNNRLWNGRKRERNIEEVKAMITVSEKAVDKLKAKVEENKASWVRVFIRGAG
jgi:hypothetical protein